MSSGVCQAQSRIQEQRLLEDPIKSVLHLE
jgi:hypothetical protein